MRVYQLVRLRRFLDLFKHIVHLFDFLQVLLLISSAEGQEAILRMDFNHVSVDFAVLLSTGVKFLIYFDILKFLPCDLLSNEDDIGECKEYDIK